jgi:hypothetical protein
MLGREALVAGPVDTIVLVTPGRFRECLELVGADPGVDAVLALTTTTAGSDLVPEVGAARLPVPIAAAAMALLEVVRLLSGPGGGSPAVPACAYAECRTRRLRRVRRLPAHAAPLLARIRCRPGDRGWNAGLASSAG